MVITTTSTDARPDGTPKALPVAPDTATVRSQITARLHAIEAEGLPAIAARRHLLDRIWRTDAPDAQLLFADGYAVIPTHPAGADRLAVVLAEQHALMLEASALRELAAALDCYDAGGSALASEIEGTDMDMMQIVHAPTLASPPVETDTDERDYTLQLLRYLAEVREEIWRRGESTTRRGGSSSSPSPESWSGASSSDPPRCALPRPRCPRPPCLGPRSYGRPASAAYGQLATGVRCPVISNRCPVTGHPIGSSDDPLPSALEGHLRWERRGKS